MGRALVNKGGASALPSAPISTGEMTVPMSGRAIVNAFAKGTKKAPKGAAMVGEKGKEIVIMKGGEKVIPNNKVSKYMRGEIMKAKFKKK